MTHPEIEFLEAHDKKDRALYTFIIRRVIAEYRRKATRQTIPRVKLLEKRNESGNLGEARRDVTQILAPPGPRLALLVQALTRHAAHEIAHQWIWAITDDLATMNNLVHYADNTGTYIYKKRLANRLMLRRYGVPSVTMVFFDVAALLKDKDTIAAKIRAGEGRGKNLFFGANS